MDRQVNLISAYRNARATRIERAEVREERLKTPSTGLPGTLGFTAWRGRSGRRYLCANYFADSRCLDPRAGAVILALRRDVEGVSTLIGARVLQAEADFPAMQARILAAGGTEIAVHSLVSDLVESASVAEDLNPLQAPVQALDPAPETPAAPAIALPRRKRGPRKSLPRTKRYFSSC